MSVALWWGAVGLLWGAALWRFPPLPGPWGVPDGLLIALLAWAFAHREPVPPTTALRMGGLLGILKDLAGGGPFGAWGAILAGTAWLATRGARTIARDHPWAQLLWVTAFALGTELAYAALLGVAGSPRAAGALLGYFLIPSALATALVSLGLFPLLKRER